MTQLHKHILFLQLILVLCSGIQAQEMNGFTIKHYDNSSGLSNSSVNTIFRDVNDILWIGTWDGLNRFDGTEFQIFNYSKEHDFKSIGNNVIQEITEDKFGNIWMSTIGGISKYSKSSGKFSNFFYNKSSSTKVSEQEYVITTDTSGLFYCFNKTTGLHFYHQKKDSLQLISLKPFSSNIIKMRFDKANYLWILTDKGSLEKYKVRPNLPVPQFILGRNLKITNFFVANDRMFFISNGDLFELDKNNGTERKISEVPTGINNIVYYQNLYLVSGAAAGLKAYNENFLPEKFFTQELKDIEDLKITSLATGTQDILWIGTDGNGVIQVSPQKNTFVTITTSRKNSFNRAVRAFCKNEDDLWVGTKGNGIFIYRNFEKNIKNQRVDVISTPALDNNFVYTLKKTTDGLVFIGSDGKGLTIYDPQNKNFTKWSSIKNHEKWPEFASVYSIYEDDDGSLWLGTSGYGLIHMKIERHKKGFLLTYLKEYTFTNNSAGPVNDIIYSIAPRGTANLWVGCRYGGLNLFHKETETFDTYKALADDGSLSNNDVLSVFEDSRQNLWVGTSYGLNVLNNVQNLKEHYFKKLTTQNGLPNNTIHAISEDVNGDIWISTNKGLARINPVSLEVSYYQQADGLQNNEFCDGAVWKDEKNRLYFGGISGFNFFEPQNIKQSYWLPNLNIYKMALGGHVVTEQGMIVKPNGNVPRSFVVKKSGNSVELEMRALNYLNTDKNDYAWYLYNSGKDLLYSGTSYKINLSNILPGRYTLFVKWSNGEGFWSKEVPIFNLQVKQSPWLTSGALLIYALLLLFITWIFYKYHQNKIKIKHQLYVEHKMRAQEEEMNRNRLNFFTNIAHELQTPLTLIMGCAERRFEDLSKHQDSYDKLIHQQASKLTYLVQQVMEFRKAEAGFPANQFTELNLSEFLAHLTEPFYTLSEQLKSSFEVEIMDNMVASTDKDKIEKIVYNLLSNAFKYGDKYKTVRFSSYQEKDVLMIQAANSAADVDEKHLTKIFDQFYSSANKNFYAHQFGTGIGLAFTRHLAHMLKGEIQVTKKDNFICFTVIIPLFKAATSTPHTEKTTTNVPSILFKTITSTQIIRPESTSEVNKYALVENILNTEKKKVLIVEDEPEIRYLLRDFLKLEYIVFEAEDGAHALEVVNKEMPAIIVSDVMMPRMNGLELCEKLKNSAATCHIPFILLSARGDEEHHMEGYGAGADAYIGKPFNAVHLKMRMRSLLEYREKLHALIRNSNPGDFSCDDRIEDEDRKFLSTLVACIRKDLDSADLNAAALEKTLFLSKMQLYRKMKSLTGMTPGEFIKSVRLKETAHLLKSTNLTVLEIFYKTGFNNQSYFFREFRKNYNCSPNEYRERFTVSR